MAESIGPTPSGINVAGMLSLLARRLLLSLPTLAGVLVVVFLLLYVAPGDPVQAMVG